jgi:hypothetical protein
MQRKNLAVSIAITLLFGAHPALAREKTVTCESPGHHYKLCRVNKMHKKTVQLSRQKSSSPCVRGDTWGTERDGIWVDGGCRAEFRVSRRDKHDGWDDNWGDNSQDNWNDNSSDWDSHDKHDDSDSDIGTAAAVVAGVGLVALIAAAASDDGNNDATQHQDARNDIPDFVHKVCTRRADDQVRDEPKGRYAELERIDKAHRTSNGYQLDAFYHRYYDDWDDVSLAVCDVDDERHVTRFFFK